MVKKIIIFELHWKTGDVDTVSHEDTGDDFSTLAAAMSYAGIGGGALAALDYWKKVKNESEDQNA